MQRDYIGNTFGQMTLVCELEPAGKNRRFECRCSGCGASHVKWLSGLRTGRGVNCQREYVVRSATYASKRRAAQADQWGRCCLTCGQRKPWRDFKVQKHGLNERAAKCYDCDRTRRLQQRYGIASDQYDQLLALQSGLCALCGEPETAPSNMSRAADDVHRRLSIDHVHNECCSDRQACPKCIRGLLCALCNRMLGLAEMKTATRARFLDYLSQRPLIHQEVCA